MYRGNEKQGRKRRERENQELFITSVLILVYNAEEERASSPCVFVRSFLVFLIYRNRKISLPYNMSTL